MESYQPRHQCIAAQEHCSVLEKGNIYLVSKMLSMQKYNSGSCCKWYTGEVLFRMVWVCGHCIQLGSGLLNFIEIQPHIVLFIASG